MIGQDEGMEGAGQELSRDLGFLEAYTIGVGTMIGAGIFVLPGIVAGNAGPAGMISFLIGGCVSLLTALSMSELATGLPRAGGSYYYVNTALGSFFGSIVGWSMWGGLMFATAFYMVGFGQYLTYFYGSLPVSGSALGMAAILVVVNYRGVKEVGALQNLIVVLLIGFILVFVSTGFFHIDWEVFRPFNPKGWGAVASTAATVYVTFIGFEVIASSAEEIKNPGRNLPLSMIASVITPTVFYALVMLVATGVLPVEKLTVSNIPVADVALEYLGEIGALMMVIGAVLATVSSANASILSAARVNFAMGRDRIMTDWLNDVHPNYRTPYRAILVTGAVVLALITFRVGLEILADVASFSYLVTYALVHLAVIVMRRAEPENYEPDFQLPGLAYPIVPFLGLVSCVLIIAQMKMLVIGIGTGMLVLGATWYGFYARSHAKKVSLVGEAIAGREAAPKTQPGGQYRVVIPVANPKTERMLMQLGATIASGHAEDFERDAELVVVSVIEVPRQTSLQQGVHYEEERVQRQQELLQNARSFAEDLGVGIRTRAIVGRSVDRAVLNVIEEERASHVVLGWSGKRKAYKHVLGSNIDPIVKSAQCEMTLLKMGSEEVHRIVALVGKGPHTRIAVRRAGDFVRMNPDAELTLLNVQTPEEDQEYSPEEEGTAIIDSVAKEAGLKKDYTSKVLVADGDPKETIINAVSDFDTICVGATRSTAVAQALFGSIPEAIAEECEDASVAISRESIFEPRTVTQGLIDWLSR